MLEYYELLICLIILMLWSNHRYENNYYLQGFWLISILWYGSIATSHSDIPVFGILCMVFSIMHNLFLIERSFKLRYVKIQ